ncbi:MAG: SDR family oxidoreductase [Kiritimatiellia bacterium]
MDGRAHTVLVTGGAVRIGRRICEELAGKGWNVIVHYRHSKKEAESLVRKLDHGGTVKAVSLAADLDSAEECGTLIKRADKAIEGLDMLVNNAAVFHRDAFDSFTREDLAREITPNFMVPVILTRELARLVKSRPGQTARTPSPEGRVVNILDTRIAGMDNTCVPYRLSKKMLADFTRAAALELAPEIAVNGVAPGPVLPPSDSGIGESEDVPPELAGPIPLDRTPAPVEVATAVAFLLESDSITGDILFVDGGQHLIG